MNIYHAEFDLDCPNNGRVVHYSLEIKTRRVIMVEKIMEFIEGLGGKGYQEDIAAMIYREFGGVQTIRGFHHGVGITTIRGAE